MHFICWREKTETEDTCSKIRWVLSHQKWGSSRSFYWSHQSSNEEANQCEKSLRFSLVYHVLNWTLTKMLTELNAGTIDSDKFEDINMQVKLLCGVANCCYTCVWFKWYCLTLISLILVLHLTSEIQHCIMLIHDFTIYLRHCVSYNYHQSNFMSVNDILFINTLTCFGHWDSITRGTKLWKKSRAYISQYAILSHVIYGNNLTLYSCIWIHILCLPY